MKAVTVTDTENMLRLGEEAKRVGYNQRPSDSMLESLDPDGTHVMTFSMLHEHIAGEPVQPHVRTRWYVKILGDDKPSNLTIDMSNDDYNTLTVLAVPEVRKDGIEEAEAAF